MCGAYGGGMDQVMSGASVALLCGVLGYVVDRTRQALRRRP